MRIQNKEQSLVRACLDLLVLKGITAWRQNQGAMRIGKRFVRYSHMKGISDIIGVLPHDGRFLAIECKIHPNKLTRDQEMFLHLINESGGYGCVIYDVLGLETVLRELGYD